MRCPVSRIVTQNSFCPSYWFSLRHAQCDDDMLKKPSCLCLQWLSPSSSHLETAALIFELSREARVKVVHVKFRTF